MCITWYELILIREHWFAEGDEMIAAFKVRLEPNNKQKSMLFQCAGTARWAYNWTLARQQENYKNGGKFIPDGELRKELTMLKITEEFKWINRYSNNITKQAIKDACEAYKDFFKGKAKYPRFKSRKKSRLSFYVDTDKIKFTEGYVKLEKEIRKIHRTLDNIRTDYIQKATTMIVKTKPSRVVMEFLNISGMMKNKHLSKAVAQQRLYDFKRLMEYKCHRLGIEFVEADRFYPSSKMCSCCGRIKKDLKLSGRVYTCECGNVMDRDLNASINLSRYKSA